MCEKNGVKLGDENWWRESFFCSGFAGAVAVLQFRSCGRSEIVYEKRFNQVSEGIHDAQLITPTVLCHSWGDLGVRCFDLETRSFLGPLFPLPRSGWGYPFGVATTTIREGKDALVAAGSDSRSSFAVWRWDEFTGEAVLLYTDYHQGRASRLGTYDVDFVRSSSSPERLCALSLNKTLRIFDVERMVLQRTFDDVGASSWRDRMAYSPRKESVVARRVECRDGLAVVDLRTLDFSRQFSRNSSRYDFGGMSFLDDDVQLCIGCDNGEVLIYDLRQLRDPTLVLQNAHRSLMICPPIPIDDEGAFATSGNDSMIKTWDSTGALMRECKIKGVLVRTLVNLQRDSLKLSGSLFEEDSDLEERIEFLVSFLEERTCIVVATIKFENQSFVTVCCMVQ